ncbi:hypothetical protein U1Q18_014675, partial [Sarracenia purpurea var. burkii]
GKDLSVLACVIPRSKPQPSSPLFPLFPLPSCFSSGPSLTFSISVSPTTRDAGDVHASEPTSSLDSLLCAATGSFAAQSCVPL